MSIFDGYLLVSDMDGTLLNSKGKLSEENRKAIDYFVENGGKFTLATGRMVASVRRFIDKISTNLPIVLYNGTKIYDYNEEKTIYEEFLEEERKETIKKIKELHSNFGIELYIDETVYIYQDSRFTQRFSKLGYDIVFEVDDEVWKKRWTKVLILGEKEELNELEEKFIELFGSGPIIRSGDNYLEMVPYNNSKGQALKQLIEIHNLHNHTVITVGDNMNDVELLEVAHHGFAVKNGNERLIKVAKNIAPSNDENAIEFLVEKIKNKEL